MLTRFLYLICIPTVLNVPITSDWELYPPLINTILVGRYDLLQINNLKTFASIHHDLCLRKYSD